jgi:hydroxymethylpyrimidine/phosphomethylpyrimidine kinase
MDLLLQPSTEPLWLQAPRIATANTHGTGCTLSSAIAAHLALGATLAQAVQLARDFVRQALQAGASVKTGQGEGPLNHGFAPLPMQLRPL